jgi:tetratricopeptide (TPR) repeat protein
VFSRVLFRCAACIAVAAALGACAADPFLGITESAVPPAVELDDTPFFPQQDYQCGPAALATVLVDSGVAVHPDELTSKIYLPERQGSLQAELLAASREHGRVPYVIPAEFPALVAEVSRGRPVLVLQNLGVKAFPTWHYAVVVGYSRERREVILRSGTEKRRVTRAGVFAKTWRRGGNWGLVALAPGELPATDDSRGYLRAVAAAESVGRTELSEPSYAAAAARWPDSSLAWLGLGNSAYARGEPAAAEHLYRRALEVDSENAVALTNLATAVAELGRCGEARDLLRTATALPDMQAPIRELLAQSQAELDACQ